MHFSTVALATLAMSCQTSLGHMIMANPIPFGVDTLNTSPLQNAKPGSSQSDFPCKQRTGVYDISAMNNMEVGQPQLLSFNGSASHGGGTCLISVSMDKEPTYKSTWKVIQVYEGGCPTSGDGNDGSTPDTFVIPKGFPNGRATLSWTWYNKIGNREVYQNCAPITVTGGSDNKDYYNSLPNLYVINLPTSECESVETTDLKIPFPGQFVLQDSKSIKAASGPSCSASAAAMTSGVSGYKSATSNEGAAYSAPAKNNDKTGAPASSAAQATSAAASDAGSSAAASSYSAASTAASGMTTISTAAPGSSAAPASASYPTMAVSANAGISGPATGASSAAIPLGTGTSCTGDAISCSSDGSKFGLCDNGSIVWQAVASGTKCQNGQIMKKRALRQAHVRRHLQNAANGIHEA